MELRENELRVRWTYLLRNCEYHTFVVWRFAVHLRDFKVQLGLYRGDKSYQMNIGCLFGFKSSCNDVVCMFYKQSGIGASCRLKGEAVLYCEGRMNEEVNIF